LIGLPEAAKQPKRIGETSRPLHVAVLLAVAAAIMLAGAADAGPPFRTDDPEPVDYQHWEIYVFSVGTRVHGDTSGILPGIEVNYGAAPNLQLHIVMPIAYDNQSGSALFGSGDTELGVKYRLIDEDENGWRPMIGIFPMLELSTGNARRGLERRMFS
jgi:hypothetical protein